MGIDPQSHRHILDNVKELNGQGMTVLYATHCMEEAQEISHRIAIMDWDCSSGPWPGQKRKS